LPDGVESRRMKIYAELFYNNIEGFINNNFPVLHAVVEESIWQKVIRQFMVKHRCKSPIFAEIGREYLQFLETESFQSSDLASQLPDFTLELAYYEWLELVLSIDQSVIDWVPVEQSSQQFLLKKQLKVSDLSRLGSFSYPVHQISDSFIPGLEDKQDSHLLIYRNRQHQINFILLAPMSALLFQKLSEADGETVEMILLNLAEEIGFKNSDEFLLAGCNIIDEWCQKDIVYW